MTHIAFIGLGNMGGPMAHNLLKAGHSLTVSDLNEAAVAKAVNAGATAASSIAECIKDAEVVITMLPGDKVVREVYDDVIGNAPTSALLIDCSTISASMAKEIAETAAAKDYTMLDAPVSGGTAGAEAGTLTFIVGGESENLSRAQPILSQMGKNIFHAGGHGAGQMAKICNNMLLGIMMIGTSEALNMGMAYGLDPKVMSDIMQQSSGNNWVLNVYNPVPGVMETAPSARGYQGGFGNSLMTKDLGLAQTAANDCSVATPLGKYALKLYQQHVASQDEERDFSSIINLIKEM